MQATVVMLKGKQARDFDDVVGKKMQLTVMILLGKKIKLTLAVLLEKYTSDCVDVVGQKMQ